MRAPVPAISARGHGVPRQADAVFLRALAKDPSHRFPSCAEFVATLRDAYADAADTTHIVAAPGPRRAAERARGARFPVAVSLLALVLLGGAIAGAVIAGGRGPSKAAPPVTITERGTTVRETVTAQPPPSSSTPAASGSTLADQGYRRLQGGDAAGALPLLEAAGEKLRGTGSLLEAYNDYNLAYALAKTQGCSAQVLQLLDASEAIQGHRKEIDRLRKGCRRSTGRDGGG